MSPSSSKKLAPVKTKYTFVEGDTELADLYSFIDNIVKQSDLKSGAKYPSCARAKWKPTEDSLISLHTTNRISFVHPGTNEPLLAARYIGGSLQIIVVKQKTDSTAPPFNDGLPTIIVPTMRRNGLRAVWCQWNPGTESDVSTEDEACVERLSVNNPGVSRARSSTPSSSMKRSTAGYKQHFDEEMSDENAEDEPPSKRQKAVQTSPSSIKSYLKTPLRQSTKASADPEIPKKPTAILSSSQAAQVQPKVQAAPEDQRKATPATETRTDDIIVKSIEPFITTQSGTHSQVAPITAFVKSIKSSVPPQIIPTPRSTPVTAEKPDMNHKSPVGLNYVFKRPHNDTVLRKIPAAKITNGKRIFEHALCSGIANLSTSILQVIFNEESIFVTRDFEEDFKTLNEKLKDVDIGEIVVLPIEWEE